MINNSKEKEVIEAITHMASLDINDDIVFVRYYNKVIDLLSIDENDTVDIINSLSEDQVSWISSAFDQISGKLQSKKFIQCIKSIAEKYPFINEIKNDVEDAINALND